MITDMYERNRLLRLMDEESLDLKTSIPHYIVWLPCVKSNIVVTLYQNQHGCYIWSFLLFIDDTCISCEEIFVLVYAG